MRATVLVNDSAGTVLTMGQETVRAVLQSGFAEAGRETEIRFEPADRLDRLLADAARKGMEGPLIVGGGDGTASLAARRLAGTEVTLGLLPLGTMNLLARALGTPLDLGQAAAALGRGRPADIDLGEVNGRLFVHHVSLGLHPRMIMLRNASGYRTRLQKVWASARSWARVVNRPPFFWIGAEVSGRTIRARTPSVIVTNNRLSRELGSLPLPERLDGGMVEVHIAKAQRRIEMVTLSLAAFMGRWDDEALFTSLMTERCRIEMRRPRVRASLDGELVRLDAPLDVSIRPRALSVLMPGTARNG
ncbi:hypothetical protein HW532_16920 [Kaustia mangrovi]|uniref:DAGKc domain-containing protein n=1 Tax=Kaustia mangrovi TaxID=2593653 RepID=A0A7S8C6D7_9HYPH|nr:diacylglycerol kinase family protein [Kaustia mangrovi]QPC44231.1 hypothetical protein HW532_16920 [Kaustia mangrovi]